MRHLEFLQMQNSVRYMSHSYSIAPVSIQCINTDLACEFSLLYSSVIERDYPENIFLGPVVQRPINANPGLNFNLGLFFFSSKAFSWTIFSILFRIANRQIVDKKN